jgi:hypothetical protein
MWTTSKIRKKAKYGPNDPLGLNINPPLGIVFFKSPSKLKKNIFFKRLYVMYVHGLYVVTPLN